MNNVLIKDGVISCKPAVVNDFKNEPRRILELILIPCTNRVVFDESLIDTIQKNSKYVTKVIKNDPEFVGDFLLKVLSCYKPARIFRLMVKTRVIKYLFPELAKLRGIESKEGATHKDVFQHTLAVLDNISFKTRDPWLRLAALLHDIGKPNVKIFEKGTWKFPNHHYIGSRMVPNILKRYALNEDEKKVKYIVTLVNQHMQPTNLINEPVTDAAVRRFSTDVGEFLDDLMVLVASDITTNDPEKEAECKQQLGELIDRILKLRASDELRLFKLQINGFDIMKTFGIGNDGRITEIKDEIKKMVMKGDLPDDRIAQLMCMRELGPKYNLTVVNTDIQ